MVGDTTEDEKLDRIFDSLYDFKNSSISLDKIEKIVLRLKKRRREDSMKALFYIQLMKIYGKDNVEFIQKGLFKVRGHIPSKGYVTKNGKKAYFLCHYSNYPSSEKTYLKIAFYGVSKESIKKLTEKGDYGYVVFLMNYLESNKDTTFIIPSYFILNNLKYISEAKNGYLRIQIVMKDSKYFFKMIDKEYIGISQFKMDLVDFFNSHLTDEYEKSERKYNEINDDKKRILEIYKR